MHCPTARWPRSIGCASPRRRMAFLQPLRVHRFVISAEFSRFDRTPPGLIVSIPLHGSLETIFERDGRMPPDPIGLAAIDGIAPIMAGSIFHESDQAFRLSKQGQQLLGHDDVFSFVATADVIHLSRLSVQQDLFDRGTVVLHSKPIAALATITV